MIVKGVEQIIEGEEYKLFEDLYFDQETNRFIPFPIGFDGSLMNQIPRSARLLSKNETIAQNL